jgi:hypothetical protein
MRTWSALKPRFLAKPRYLTLAKPHSCLTTRKACSPRARVTDVENRINPMRDNTVAITIGGVLLLGMAVVLWFIVLKTLDYTKAADFETYYAESLVLSQRGNPYSKGTLSILERQFHSAIDRATDPPTFLILIEPLSYFRRPTAFLIWSGLNLICGTIAVFLLIYSLGPNLSNLTKWMLLFPATLLFIPFSINIELGQSKLIVLLLLVLTELFIKQKREAAAGVALAFGSLLRVFPVLLLCYFFTRRLSRAFWYAIASLIIGGIATMACLGPDRTIDFFRALPYLTAAQWSRQEQNLALVAIITRITWGIQGFANGSLQQLSVLLIQFSVLALTLWCSLRSEPSKGDIDGRLFSLWVVTALVLLPIIWRYDLVFLLIAFANQISAWIRGRSSTRVLIAMVVSYCLASGEGYLFHFGYYVLGKRITSFVFPFAVKGAALALPFGYLAAYWFATEIRGFRVRAATSDSCAT